MPSFRTKLAALALAAVTALPVAHNTLRADDAPPSKPAVAGPGANTLTDAEKQAGWKLLFDGQSLAGWNNFKK